MIVLTLENVQKNFGGRVALPAVSFELERAAALGLTGPTGCGKTTLLRIVAGLLDPDAGRITIDGRVANTPKRVLPPIERGIGMVFQDLALWPHMNAAKHLDFVLKLHLRDRSSRHDRIEALLSEFDLAAHASNRPAEMSRGQRQRLAIARAVATEPPLLLLDEPVSSQDPDAIHRIVESLRARRDAGTAMIIATHDRSVLDAIGGARLTFRDNAVHRTE